jgi:hypothetical protein
LDKEFQDIVNKYDADIVVWWKKKYGYSSNDERFLTATREQIYNDRLEEIVSIYIEKFRFDPERERIERGRLLDPEFDMKENEAFKKKLQNIKIIKANG